MTWEYRTIRLIRPEGSGTWEDEGRSYSRQLSAAALEGWELVDTHPWPWVVFRRQVTLEYPRDVEAGLMDPHPFR